MATSLPRTSSFLLFAALSVAGCGRQAAVRARAEAIWAAALARAATEPEVIAAATAAQAAEVAYHDARARLDRREQDVVDADRQRLAQAALTAAADKMSAAKTAHTTLHRQRARATLTPADLATVDASLGEAAQPPSAGTGKR